MTAGTLIWAVLLISGNVGLPPADAGRLPGGNATAAALGLLLVVAVPLATTSVLGWRRSSRTGDAAVLAGAAVIGAVLLQIQALRTFHWLEVVAVVGGALLVTVGTLVPRSPDRPRRRGV
jgi:hypothetical protein